MSRENALGAQCNILDFQKPALLSISEILHDELLQVNESGRSKLLKVISGTAHMKLVEMPQHVIPVDSASLEKWLQHSCASIIHSLGTSGKFTMLCCEKPEVEALQEVVRENPKDYPSGLLDSLPRHFLQIQTAYLPFVKLLISKWKKSKPFD